MLAKGNEQALGLVNQLTQLEQVMSSELKRLE